MSSLKAAEIREWRDERDLSNEQLATLFEISEGYLRNILSGTDSPSRRLVHRIARVMARPVAEIEANNDGVPDEPPTQPKNEPKAPPRRQNTEKTKGPRRASEAAA